MTKMKTTVFLFAEPNLTALERNQQEIFHYFFRFERLERFSDFTLHQLDFIDTPTLQ